MNELLVANLAAVGVAAGAACLRVSGASRACVAAGGLDVGGGTGNGGGLVLAKMKISGNLKKTVRAARDAGAPMTCEVPPFLSRASRGLRKNKQNK